MDWDQYDTVLFDLDGVLTPTAEVHMRAWQQLFSGYLAERGSAEGYSEQDYFDFIDGKPRYDGVRSFLASRDIVLPEGEVDDDPDAETVCGLGNRKNAVFNRVLSTEGVRAYPGSVVLLDFLERAGKQVAVVSSSKNAPAVLDAAGLRSRFDVIVDGAVAHDLGLPGKPAPDTFVHAAEQLATPVERTVVFEDALSGVAAGHEGGFGLVVGVDRGVGSDRLRAAGADVVVSDLAELVTR
ncbi:beta-phosphoglucomutase family hydrolase [Microlunatus panaciterrae]|uniref:Beta-phosphoglucomutase n=1 Tax=Microlunatus panaciterrae TaxID=400768 RepID=A0ABS2RH39_9ACTN|nr:beta-phosphoglucomutase family hydrolase [Microlunatus panaciterrae]